MKQMRAPATVHDQMLNVAEYTASVNSKRVTYGDQPSESDVENQMHDTRNEGLLPVVEESKSNYETLLPTNQHSAAKATYDPASNYNYN